MMDGARKQVTCGAVFLISRVGPFAGTQTDGHSWFSCIDVDTAHGSVAALGSLFSNRFPMCSSSIVFSVRVIVCLFSLLFC